MTWIIFWLIGLTITTFVGAGFIRANRSLGLPVLMVFFATYIIGGNILVPRLVNLNMGFMVATLTSGSIIWGFTAQIMDMVNEIYGRRKAIITIVMAYLANLMWVSFVMTAASATPLWEPGKEVWWQSVFVVASPRVFVASGISFLFCGWLDATLFAKFKTWLSGYENRAGVVGFLASVSVRSTLTDIVNQGVDPWIFLTLAFVGTMPTETLIMLATSTMITKAILVTVDVPFFAGFKLLTRGVEREF